VKTGGGGIDFVAGDAGSGLTGTGGAGGTLAGNSAVFGSLFQAGKGGLGYIGGKGGSVLGNNGVGGWSTEEGYVYAYAGNGGAGIARGGDGGTVSDFVAHVTQWIGTPAGELYYTGGKGGSAVAGTGGAGGSVVNCSPYSEDNNLAGPIVLIAGIGGDGLTGGAGGNVTNFTNQSTIVTPPTVVSVLAGNGGAGVVGSGGRGGSVSALTAGGTGIGSVSDETSEALYVQQFNRIIAGDGGISYGSAGGVGGSLSNILTTANSSATALAAGAGGIGLKRGGDGGSILSVTADSAASVGAKVIAIAGVGGDAYAALYTASQVGNIGDNPAILSLRAFGGVNGVGGNGGSITTFSQPKTVNCAVDLIAGNGGSTVNYGWAGDSKTNVGKGGSITGVTLVGEAGRVDSTVAIKSYDTDVVQSILRSDLPTTQLDDTVGNVGVIVGAAGRVKGDLPGGDADAKSGSVTNFTAKSIMSMVAGSVDRIAAINTISNINLTDPAGVLGAFKSVPDYSALLPVGMVHDANHPAYFSGEDQTGSLGASALPGGSLWDGVVFAQNNNTGLTGPRIQS
jgi:hypothetical protein